MLSENYPSTILFANNMIRSPYPDKQSPSQANKDLPQPNPSPIPTHSTVSVEHSKSNHMDAASQKQSSSPLKQYSPTAGSMVVESALSDSEPRQHLNSPGHDSTWQQTHNKESYLDGQERYPPSSSYHKDSYHPESSPAASTSTTQSSYKRLSFTRTTPGHQPRSPQPQITSSYHSDISRQQRSHSRQPLQGMSQSPTSTEPFTPYHRYTPESNKAKRFHIDSDSEGISEGESRYRNESRYHHPQNHPPHDILNTDISTSSSQPRPSHNDREYYIQGSHRRSIDANTNNTIDHAHYNIINTDRSRGYRPTSAYHPHTSTEGGLPPLAPRPPQHSADDQIASSIRQRHQVQQLQQHDMLDAHSRKNSNDSPVKKESSGQVLIRSARGTPKGPLPIETQIALLRSVLTHDPFNCPIRKTTQAWELISQEQGIKARTCSRRFENIIQSSISGRDRPIGTEEQQATKSKLLEGLFEMMNRPQALKRMKKKRRYRSEDTDRRLLSETIRLNPFGQKVGQVAKAWEDVRDSLNMTVHARQCIRRVNRMVKPYLLRERMCQGNIPEEMRETNDDLVRQIIQLMRNSGQGETLDEDGNEDSASGTDSEDHEYAFMDGKDDDVKEDYELDDEDDEEMVSGSASEQRVQKSPEDGVEPTGDTHTSPKVPLKASNSAHPTTPPLIPSTSISAPSSVSTPTTPAKRGRPRNLALNEQSNQKNQNDVDNAIIERAKSRSNEVVVIEDMPTASESGQHNQRSMNQTSPIISHRPAHQSSTQIQNLDRSHQYLQARPGEHEHKRPTKHARTDSRGRELPIEGDREGYPSRGPSSDPRIRQARYYSSDRESMNDYSRYGPSTNETQFRELMREMRSIQDYLLRVEEQRRLDTEKQNTMHYMIEKLQHKVQQQQQQLFQLQGFVRYEYSPQGPSSSRSPQNSSHYRETYQPPIHPSASTTSSSGRYSRPIEHHDPASYQQSTARRSADRHEQDIKHHPSYLHQEDSYPSRDHDMQ